MKEESLLPSTTTGYARLVFNQPNQKVTVLWATRKDDVTVNLAIAPATCTYLVDQAGNWRKIEGPSYPLRLPKATIDSTWNDLPIIGGYTYLLIETNEPCPPPGDGTAGTPEGSLSPVCEGGRLVGLSLMGRDESSGLATLSVSCSPTRIYDLSWTRPGRTYAGVVRSVPPVGSTCTFTLTNRAGQSVSRTFHHDPHLCRGRGGGGSPGGDHPDDTHSAASGPIPAVIGIGHWHWHWSLVIGPRSVVRGLWSVVCGPWSLLACGGGNVI